MAIGPVSYGETLTTPNVQSLATVADDYAAFKGAGGTLGIPTTGTDLSAMVAYPGGAGTTGTTLAKLHARFPHAADLGAVGDDATDDTAALQASINRLQGTGETLWLEPRTFLVKGTLTISAPMTIRGRGQYDNYPNAAGTWLVHASTTGPLFSITTGLANMVRFENFGVTENQVGPASGATSWAPTPMPPVFDVENTGEGVVLSNILLSGVYWFLKFTANTSSSVGRLRLYDIDGQVFRYGIVVDGAQDVCHASRVHFWDFWNGDNRVLYYQQQNLVAVYLGRVDGFHFLDLFAFACYAGIYGTQGPYNGTGPALDINLADCYLDQCQYSILVDRQICRISASNFKTAHGSFGPSGGLLPGARAVLINATGPSTYNNDGTATSLPSVATTGANSGVQVFIGSGVSFGIPDSVFEVQAGAGVLGIVQHHATWNTNANGAPYALVGSGSRCDIALPPYQFGRTNGPLANQNGGQVTLGGNIIGGYFLPRNVIQGPVPPGTANWDQAIYAPAGAGRVILADASGTTVASVLRDQPSGSGTTAVAGGTTALLLHSTNGQFVIGMEGQSTDSLAISTPGPFIVEGPSPPQITAGSATYANLSTTAPNGAITWCTNARVGSQTAGNGTGSLVQKSGGVWYMLGGAPVLT